MSTVRKNAIIALTLKARMDFAKRNAVRAKRLKTLREAGAINPRHADSKEFNKLYKEEAKLIKELNIHWSPVEMDWVLTQAFIETLPLTVNGQMVWVKAMPAVAHKFADGTMLCIHHKVSQGGKVIGEVIQVLADGKNKEYFDPYTKVGKANRPVLKDYVIQRRRSLDAALKQVVAAA